MGGELVEHARGHPIDHREGIDRAVSDDTIYKNDEFEPMAEKYFKFEVGTPPK